MKRRTSPNRLRGDTLTGNKLPEINIPKEAIALRPVRVLVKKNTFRNYEGIKFPNPADPNRGVRVWMHRLNYFGWLKDDGNNLLIDLIGENEIDILETFPVTREGFEYLRMKLKFQVDEE